MAANISYANIAKKAAGTSEDNDETHPDTVQVQAAKTTDNNETEKKPKKTKRRNRKAEKKAAKLAAEAAEKAKSNESSEAEAEQPKVFIPAPPPKVNVWLKKSAENTQTEEENVEDEKAKKEPTPADAAVMKESTAENRPPIVSIASKPSKPLVSSALGSPWKTTQANSVQVSWRELSLYSSGRNLL